ncbi:MAG: DUF2800 domain-containing protein, partial [Sutterella sp.]
MAHALLSPSSASRWMKCRGSAALCRKVVDGTGEKSTSFADEGTFAHAVAAALLTGNDLPKSEKYSASEVADEVRPYVEFVRTLPGTLLVEQELSITWITGEDGAHGTADAVLVTDDTITVVDLKYGMGVKIDAEQNPQLAIYAGAVWQAFDYVGEIKTVKAIIVQPRLDHISECTYTVDELNDFLDEIRTCAKAANAEIGLADESLHLCPGKKQCQFCAAASRCRAYAEMVAQASKVDLPKPAMALMSDAELASALKVVDAVEQWCNRVREDAFQTLMNGASIPGFKLVAGREGPRKWSNDQEAEDLLKRMKVPVDDRYVRK